MKSVMVGHTLPLPMSVKVSIAIAIFSSLTSLASGYFRNDKQLEHRLTAVEIQQKNDSEAIREVRSDVKKLVYWALGKP